MKTFALIGASGYIAPRHVEAIKITGNNLIACLDPYDGIGYIDKHFPNASYFREAERFDRHLDRLKRKGNKVDYVSICSPNYLHDSHMRLALRNGSDVICEKPLVLKPEHLNSLREIEVETGNKVNTILQLRLHPSIIKLKERYKNTNKKHKVSLQYITPRGLWYDYSWKGNKEKSGGVVTNIGIHFFDMLMWIFGDVKSYDVSNTLRSSQGTIELKNATVDYQLSIDKEDLPWDEWKPFRSIKIDGDEIEFSDGFTDLHNKSYENILKGDGFRLDDAYHSIELVYNLKNI
jgi:UDP-N-acetyl-2-amino-2-deoxyglucuronate dehydrogenase